MGAYELVNTVNLKDLDSTGYVYKHIKSGARVVYIKNKDDNKVFTIGFRTPSENSTGVQHIIEHSTLCGSEKYPAKDPFVELVKGSLNTFLNAMTYPDKTVYPVASCNDADFKNLMDVYLDAVFYPNIYKKKEIFKQEGWHYEYDGEEYKLNGVVFNEMKGVYSSPDDVLMSKILEELFTESPYKYESGGDPEVIPTLTYDDFIEYHKKHYHPANSYIYLYGDMDIEERLEYLDKEYLSRFSASDFNIDTMIPMQPSFSEPIFRKSAYAIDKDESGEDKTYLSCSWIVGDSLDTKFSLLMQVLDYALIAAPGAILKQRFLDRGIGADISSVYESDLLQPIYSITIKNTSSEKFEEFKGIIEEVLKEIVANGIDHDMILAGINCLEFKYKEADFGTYPRGLIYGLAMFDSWLYDDTKPFIHIDCGDDYEWLKNQDLDKTFSKLVNDYLLNNKSCVYMELEPDANLAEKMKADEEKRVSEYIQTLSEDEKKAIQDDTVALKKYQDEPSTPEELDKIPLLSVEDIEKEADSVEYEETDIDGVKCIRENIFTSGITYIVEAFDATCVKQEDLPYLSLLSNCMGLMDTENYSYTQLCNEINKNSGGIATDIKTYVNSKNSDDVKVYFAFSSKAFDDEIGKLNEYIIEQMYKTKFNDKKRMREIVARIQSQMAYSMLSAGHGTSVNIALSQFSKASYYNLNIVGYEFYRFLTDFLGDFDQKFEYVVNKLNELVKLIFNKKNLLINVTAGDDGQMNFTKEASRFIEQLNDEKVENQEIVIKPYEESIALTSPSQVNYVARAWNFKETGMDYTGALRVLKIIFSYDYLWNNIRVKGGAYGCMSDFNLSGDSYFVSYRDPNVKATNEVYENAAKYVESFDVSKRDMDKYIIGTIGGMDTPLTPKLKGYRAFDAFIRNVTTDDFQKEREEVLSVTPDIIRSLAPIIKDLQNSRHICVVGSSMAIESDKDMFDKTEPLA